MITKAKPKLCFFAVTWQYKIGLVELSHSSKTVLLSFVNDFLNIFFPLAYEVIKLWYTLSLATAVHMYNTSGSWQNNKAK